MISFDDFLMEDGSPIYVQILVYIRRGIVSGCIRHGDELPSRRVLSSLLGVNPNTVQKAYRMLEEEGLIVSHTGAKSLIVINEDTKQKIRAQLLEEDARKAVRVLKQLGIELDEAQSMLVKYWNSEE